MDDERSKLVVARALRYVLGGQLLANVAPMTPEKEREAVVRARQRVADATRLGWLAAGVDADVTNGEQHPIAYVVAAQVAELELVSNYGKSEDLGAMREDLLAEIAYVMVTNRGTDTGRVPVDTWKPGWSAALVATLRECVGAAVVAQGAGMRDGDNEKAQPIA